MWICPYPGGHIQATGVDAAGRKQYLYHPRWRERRDMEKFEDMLVFARTLPRLRKRVDAELAQSGELTYDRVSACAVRLLDRGFFRVGGEDYAVRNESYGLATMKKSHVSMRDGGARLRLPGQVRQAPRAGGDRPGGRRDRGASSSAAAAAGDELLAYKRGRRWADLRSEDINAWLKEATGKDVSAKDFRTWAATVLAAVALAVSEEAAATKTGRKRAITRAIKEVAHYLGNTPAVARASYIDPRVFDRYRDGEVIDHRLVAAAGERNGDATAIQGPLEKAVMKLLDELGGASSASRASTASSRVGLIVKI